MVSKSELEKKAEELGIKNVKKMTKEQLMEMLRRRGASVEGKAPPKKAPVRASEKRVVRAPERPAVRPGVRPPERRPNMTLKQREEVKRRQMVSRQQMQQRNAKMQEIKQQAQARAQENKVRPPQVMQKKY
jgi:hypothetical protein